MLTVTRQGLVASAAVTADRPRSHPGRPPSYDKKVSLVLQGGGALGSYQAGVYEALAPSEYLPDWVAGISIGAINAAIIAGNPLEKPPSITVVIFCWRILLISESMDHHDSEIMDDRSID